MTKFRISVLSMLLLMFMSTGLAESAGPREITEPYYCGFGGTAALHWMTAAQLVPNGLGCENPNVYFSGKDIKDVDFTVDEWGNVKADATIYFDFLPSDLYDKDLFSPNASLIVKIEQSQNPVLIFDLLSTTSPWSSTSFQGPATVRVVKDIDGQKVLAIFITIKVTNVNKSILY